MAERGVTSVVCNDTCGCPIPCPGNQGSCRCAAQPGGGETETHSYCSCNPCTCNPCTCDKTASGTTTAAGRLPNCKCGEGCTCGTTATSKANCKCGEGCTCGTTATAKAPPS